MRKLCAAALTMALLMGLTACRVQITTDVTTEAASTASDVIDFTTTEEPPATQGTTEETTTEPEETTGETTTGETATAETLTEVDLSITLPEANGKMAVDTRPDNKYTSAVAAAKGLDAGLLTAVYTVPESDQNYVFEFRDAHGRSADDIRRVYLLTSDCKITSTAAADAAERQGMSVAENWFCMNVLIKGVIFPEIKDKF